jgi:hypothetical protein
VESIFLLANTPNLISTTMKFTSKISLALGALALASSAVAAPVVHDTVAEFQPFNTATQGSGASAARSDVGNMFDGNTATMFSLGLGGYLDFLIKPATNAITSGTVIELTGLRSGHNESANFLLGIDGGGWMSVGTLINNNDVGSVTNTNSIDAFLSVVDNNNPATVFKLTVNSGAYNSIRLLDTSVAYFGASNTRSADGFDVAEFSVTSNPVPEPTSLALLGAGLLGLSVLRRRKN